MNTKFADVVNSKIEFAPDRFSIDGKTYWSPTKDEYALAGYWPCSESHPAPESGKHEVEGTPVKTAVENTRAETRIVPLTDEQEAENEARIKAWEDSGSEGDPPELIEPTTEEVEVKYTTYTVTRVWELEDDPVVYRKWTPRSIKVACGDKWSTVKQALEAADLFDEFVMSQYIDEENDSFKTGYALACEKFGKENVDAILAASEVTE